MQRKTKKLAPIFLFLLVFAALICGLLYFYLTGQPEPVSAEQISDALISQDLQPMDITDTAQGNFPGAGLTDCIVAEQDDIRFEFYTFDNPSSALRVYREARKLIITTKMETPRVEIEQGKANYKYYSLAAGSLCISRGYTEANGRFGNDAKRIVPLGFGSITEGKHNKGYSNRV